MNNGDVLFVRDGNDEDSGDNDNDNDNIWDDTALIKAYDRAVNAAKAQIVPRLNTSALDESGDKAPSRKGPRKGISMKNKKAEWQVGAPCRAVYSEDGKIYEATIQSIKINAGTCVVKYIGYENEEEVFVSELMVSEGPEARAEQEEQALCYAAEEELGIDGNKEAKASKPHVKSFPRRSEQNGPDRPRFGSQFPPQYPYFGSQVPQSYSMLPPMFVPPPPPPLSITSGMPVEDTDALSAMLMSWYMSGFHTGYYQGLQQSKNMSSALKKNQGTTL